MDCYHQCQCRQYIQAGKLYVPAPQAGGCLVTLVVWGPVVVGLWLKFGGWASIVHWLKGWF